MLETLATRWDLIVIGGGINGAGIFREAARNGLRTLLLDGNDFAWGASSRSSKLIHGGLRYLKEGQIGLMHQSVRARERLLAEAPGLVHPLGVVMPLYKGIGPKPWHLVGALALYDLMALKRRSRYYPSNRFRQAMPFINGRNLIGGVTYGDAAVDDARLVIRLITEGVAHGGHALNYAVVVAIGRDPKGQARTVVARDSRCGAECVLTTRVVVNTTGTTAERLCAGSGNRGFLRPLKGSHLILPRHALPFDHGVSFFHPADGRPVFAFPWEGAVIAGTTDVDYDGDLSREPIVADDEKSYLIEGLASVLGSGHTGFADCLAVFAGVRPVWGRGGVTPSREPRWHHIEAKDGVVTVTGGKLTTFGHAVRDALRAARPFLAGTPLRGTGARLIDPVAPIPRPDGLSPWRWRRLCGRYGPMALHLVATADPADLESVDGTPSLWAELAHAAAHEWVRHLDDLLLRRVRIGLTTADGADRWLPRVRQVCGPHLGWDDQRWEMELRRYRDKWRLLHDPAGAQTAIDANGQRQRH